MSPSHLRHSGLDILMTSACLDSLWMLCHLSQLLVLSPHSPRLAPALCFWFDENLARMGVGRWYYNNSGSISIYLNLLNDFGDVHFLILPPPTAAYHGSSESTLIHLYLSLRAKEHLIFLQENVFTFTLGFFFVHFAIIMLSIQARSVMTAVTTINDESPSPFGFCVNINLPVQTVDRRIPKLNINLFLPHLK